MGGRGRINSLRESADKSKAAAFGGESNMGEMEKTRERESGNIVAIDVGKARIAVYWSNHYWGDERCKYSGG